MTYARISARVLRGAADTPSTVEAETLVVVNDKFGTLPYDPMRFSRFIEPSGFSRTTQPSNS